MFFFSSSGGFCTLFFTPPVKAPDQCTSGRRCIRRHAICRFGCEVCNFEPATFSPRRLEPSPQYRGCRERPWPPCGMMGNLSFGFFSLPKFPPSAYPRKKYLRIWGAFSDTNPPPRFFYLLSQSPAPSADAVQLFAH